MERKVLQEKLELCAPALSSTTVVPVLACFAFTGTKLMAYNDGVGIAVPCKTDFKGCVGVKLLELVKLSRAKEVEFTVDGNDLHVKAASSKFKLPITELKEFTDLFVPPDVQEQGVLHVSVKDFIHCAGQLMRSVSDDTSFPDQLGITVVPGKKNVSLYSTDHNTLSKAVLKLTKETEIKRACLSKAFVEQLLVLARGEMTLKLEIEDDHATLVAGSTILYGKLIYVEDPRDFEDMIARHFDTVALDKLAPIPSKLKNIIERAIVIAESKNDSAKTRVAVQGDRMRFITKSERGEVIDSMQVTSKQGEVKLTISAKFIRKGIDDFELMLMTPKGCIMAKEHVTYMISAQD